MDTFKITILRGGIVRTDTGVIGDINHENAEQFIRTMEEMAGGPTEHQHKAEGMLHHHEHSHHHETETE